MRFGEGKRALERPILRKKWNDVIVFDDQHPGRLVVAKPMLEGLRRAAG
jgi:hypothetical protein